MDIFRQLRWKLTLSYTLVTVGALLVITLILGGILFTQVFLPVQRLNPEQMIAAWMSSDIESVYPIWSQILSRSPVDMELVRLYLQDPAMTLTGVNLFRVGALQFSVSTNASIRVLIFGPDGTLLGSNVADDPLFDSAIGHTFDPSQVPGLETPFHAALAGDRNPKHLYTELVPNQEIAFAAPLFNRAPGYENQVVGVIAVLVDAIPTQEDIPAYVLNLAGRSLLVFLLGTGITGAMFGSYFAHGLATRFKRLSTATDLWSEGDFSTDIDDTTGDEISQFAQRLNDMARQLQALLRRRQAMAVSEERNRLARDLHDSAKQQALAASFELGTALTLFERDPPAAKNHLMEADALVDAVRKELTNLVHELRPQDVDGQDFSETLREYALEWSNRNAIEMDFQVDGNNQLPLEVREILFRIAQEALANIARHSAARCTQMSLAFEANTATMVIQDDGRGFDPLTQYGGIGLASMRERAKAVGGHVAIESAPGQGTRIVATLPLAESTKEES